MKKVSLLSGVLLAVLLLVFSAAAQNAARDALMLWWRSVVPALLPFCIAIGLIGQSGPLVAVKNSGKASKRGELFLCFLMGAVSGYPSGARMCAMLGLSKYAFLCNLCSPAFLLGVVAIDMYGGTALMWPLCLSHYLSAPLTACLFFRFFPKNNALPQKEQAPFLPTAPSAGMIGTVGDAMLTMLRIGGSIVLFYEIIALVKEIGVLQQIDRLSVLFALPSGTVSAMLTGILEMTAGCSAITALALSFPVTAALCSAVVSFGGICVLLQSSMYIRIDRRYLFLKTAQALIAGGMAYGVALILPFRDAIPAMQAIPQAYLQNGFAGLSLFLSSSVAIAMLCLAVTISQDHP